MATRKAGYRVRADPLSLRQLSYFAQVAESRSFTKAASILHITQPALSRHIAKLEDSVRARLFSRSDKGVVLTEAGSIMYRKALHLLSESEALREEVAASTAIPTGTLSFGLPPSMYEMVSRPLVERYLTHYPRVLLRATEGISAALHESVLGGRLDTAIVSDIEPLAGLRGLEFLAETLYLAGPRGARLNRTSEARLEDVARLPMIVTSRPNALRVIVDRGLREAGLRTNIRLETDSTRMMLDLVQQGLGYTVIPYCAVARLLRERRLSAAPVPSMSVNWLFIHPSDRVLSIAAVKLLDLAAELAHELIAAQVWHGARLLLDRDRLRALEAMRT